MFEVIIIGRPSSLYTTIVPVSVSAPAPLKITDTSYGWCASPLADDLFLVRQAVPR